MRATITRRAMLTGRCAPGAGLPSQSPGEAGWLHLQRRAMAARFQITLAADWPGGLAAAKLALDAVERLEERLSVFRSDSELSALNRASRAAVAEDVFALLCRCQRLHAETEGAFDITTTPLSRCWGFLARQGRLAPADAISAALGCVGMARVHLEPGPREVAFAVPGMELNLGAIGKGYALDCAAQVLRRRGVPAALLSGGGSSVLALGAGQGDGWRVALRDPADSRRRLGTLRLRDCALGVSGSAEQGFWHEGRRYSHILDPRSGWPVCGMAGVAVAAPDAALADALATAFFVGGRELAERYCAQHPDVLALMTPEEDSSMLIVVGENDGCRLEWTDA